VRTTGEWADDDGHVTDARPLPSSLAPPHPDASPEARQSAWLRAHRLGQPGLRGSRADLRSALLTVLALAVAGLAAGGLWIWLAPRADYRVTAGGAEPIGATPNIELFMADDGVFVLIFAALGLIAGTAVWLHRRRRGALTLTALATGMLAAGIVAWQLGEWAAPGPTHAQLTDLGATVTTGLSLRATAGLAVGPFMAVLAYLVATALTPRDDLGRIEDEPADGPPELPGPPLLGPPLPPPPRA
jgi:hypothetical protein